MVNKALLWTIIKSKRRKLLTSPLNSIVPKAIKKQKTHDERKTNRERLKRDFWERKIQRKSLVITLTKNQDSKSTNHIALLRKISIGNPLLLSSSLGTQYLKAVKMFSKRITKTNPTSVLCYTNNHLPEQLAVLHSLPTVKVVFSLSDSRTWPSCSA